MYKCIESQVGTGDCTVKSVCSTLAQVLRSSVFSFEKNSSLKLKASMLIHSNYMIARLSDIHVGKGKKAFENILTPPRSGAILSCFPVITTNRRYWSITQGCICRENNIANNSFVRTFNDHSSSGNSEKFLLKLRRQSSRIPRGSSMDVPWCRWIHSRSGPSFGP